MEEKINLIKAIVRHHPSLGVAKGWSDYTGGFKDSGNWKWEKMIDAPDWELREFHKFLESEENKHKINNEKRMAEIKMIAAMTPEQQAVYRNIEYEKEQQERVNLFKELEYRVFWGIKSKK